MDEAGAIEQNVDRPDLLRERARPLRSSARRACADRLSGLRAWRDRDRWRSPARLRRGRPRPSRAQCPPPPPSTARPYPSDVATFRYLLPRPQASRLLIWTMVRSARGSTRSIANPRRSYQRDIVPQFLAGVEANRRQASMRAPALRRNRAWRRRARRPAPRGARGDAPDEQRVRLGFEREDARAAPRSARTARPPSARRFRDSRPATAAARRQAAPGCAHKPRAAAPRSPRRRSTVRAARRPLVGRRHPALPLNNLLSAAKGAPCARLSKRPCSAISSAAAMNPPQAARASEPPTLTRRTPRSSILLERQPRRRPPAH